MNSQITDSIISNHALEEKLVELKSFGDPNSLVISCYLDMLSGKNACESFITENLRQLLDHAPSLDNDTRQTLVESFIEKLHQHWHPQAKGLTIFCENFDRIPEFICFALPQNMGNQFSVYTKANILPLLTLKDERLNGSVLAYTDEVIQIYDINLGQIRPMAWATAPRLSKTRHITVSQDEPREFDKRLQRVCLSLLRSQDKPMLVAANAENLEHIKQWLPRKIAWKITDTIELPYELGHSAFSEFLQAYFQQQKQIDTRRIDENIKNSLHVKGATVLGPVSTLEALRNQQVDRLLISPTENQRVNTHCLHCNSLLVKPMSQTCNHCGLSIQEPWDPMIEASWMAEAQQVPVIEIKSDELSYLGGMACFIKQKREADLIPIKPAPSKGLDLVA